MLSSTCKVPQTYALKSKGQRKRSAPRDIAMTLTLFMIRISQQYGSQRGAKRERRALYLWVRKRRHSSCPLRQVWCEAPYFDSLSRINRNPATARCVLLPIIAMFPLQGTHVLPGSRSRTPLSLWANLFLISSPLLPSRNKSPLPRLFSTWQFVSLTVEAPAEITPEL